MGMPSKYVFIIIMLKALIAGGSTRAHMLLIRPSFCTTRYSGISPPLMNMVAATIITSTLRPYMSLRDRG
ncbi:hypothetical protein D3C72_2446840 [compost metagenome]